jgi:hypothetical protein
MIEAGISLRPGKNCPAHFVSASPWRLRSGTPVARKGTVVVLLEEWRDGLDRIWVYFDAEDKVQDKEFIESTIWQRVA